MFLPFYGQLVRPRNPRRVPDHPGDELIRECVKEEESLESTVKSLSFFFIILLISLFVASFETL